MDSLIVPWSALKEFVNSKSLSIQYVNANDNYYLLAFDSAFSLKCILNKSVNVEEVEDFETNYKSNGNQKLDQPLTIGSLPAIAAKTLPDGKKLYKRVKGIEVSAVAGSSETIWVCDMEWVKFMGIEFIGANQGDKCSLVVLDRSTSPFYGVPDAQLNQFGFDVNIAKDFYIHKSEFDADLHLGLQIKLIYTSNTTHTVGVNFIMNEVV